MAFTRLLIRFVWVGALLAFTAAAAYGSPVLHYTFPASWDGTDTAVTDLSPAGNHGYADPGAVLSDIVPPGAPAGAKSLKPTTVDNDNAQRGGVGTTNLTLLSNSAVAAAGGFQFETTFMWDGTFNTALWAGVQKIVDYAGTESLQLIADNGNEAVLRFQFDDNPDNSISTTIQPNTWYHVIARFDTQGNVVDGEGNLAGMASLVIDGGTPISGAVVKTPQGDDLARPIGIGALGLLANNFSLVTMHGLIYDASVSLVPEPATLAFLGLGGLALLRRRRA